MPDQVDFHAIADELRQIADMGSTYSRDSYDLERFNRTRQLSARLVALIERRASAEVLEEYTDRFDHLSPLVGGDAVVVHEGRILLVRRRDDGLWAMPGGLVEVGETVAEAATRELWEETGVRAKPSRWLGRSPSMMRDAFRRFPMATRSLSRRSSTCSTRRPRAYR